MQTWPDCYCYFCKIMLFEVTLFAETIWSILFNLPSSLVSALCCAVNQLSSRYAMNVGGWSMRALASAKFLFTRQYSYRRGDKLFQEINYFICECSKKTVCSSALASYRDGNFIILPHLWDAYWQAPQILADIGGIGSVGCFIWGHWSSPVSMQKATSIVIARRVERPLGLNLLT